MRSLLDVDMRVLILSNQDYSLDQAIVFGLVRTGLVASGMVAALLGCGNVAIAYSWRWASMPRQNGAVILNDGARCCRLVAVRSGLAASERHREIDKDLNGASVLRLLETYP